MSNETKVGILAIVSIAILIWGYKFLKGQNLLTSSNILYVEYAQADMLSVSSPVLINGFRVGVITDMYLKEEDMQTIVTVLDIERGVKIPKTTVAQLISTDITGGKGINLSFKKPCSGEDCAKSGDYLKGDTKGILQSMIPQEELDRYLNQLAATVGAVYDTLNQRLVDPNAVGIGKSYQDFAATLSSLNATTARIDAILSRSSGNIEKSIENVEALTSNLSNNMASVDSILNNTVALTAQLREIDLKKTIDATSENANQAITKLKGTLENADKALAEVTALLNGVKAGEGTVGKLFTDDGLYDKLAKASEELEKLLLDVKESPYRYIPLKNRAKIKRYDKKDGKNQD
ncbi:MAG: phospholipid/cholesterol/gamma-HCH transport system substrate-binding protein [Saprospiraceae bacterium]|jgi:phospholipid/cholesterol/gamma-HCH transport system substrate-binding protein